MKKVAFLSVLSSLLFAASVVLSPSILAAASVPDAPTGVSAIAGNGQATISFTPPANNGGATITAYTVISDNNTRASGTGSPIVITGLTNGRPNNIYVTATNAAGNSAPSSTVSVTPLATLSNSTAPLNIAITLDNPLGNTNDIPSLVALVLKGAVILLTPLVVIMLFYSGFLFVMARGNDEKLKSAKTTLLYTVIGAAIVLGAEGLALVIQHTISCLGGANC